MESVLTDAERRVIHLLREAWEAYLALPGASYQAENLEFNTALHTCQGIIARRVVERTDQDVFIEFV